MNDVKIQVMNEVNDDDDNVNDDEVMKSQKSQNNDKNVHIEDILQNIYADDAANYIKTLIGKIQKSNKEKTYKKRNKSNKRKDKRNMITRRKSTKLPDGKKDRKNDEKKEVGICNKPYEGFLRQDR